MKKYKKYNLRPLLKGQNIEVELDENNAIEYKSGIINKEEHALRSAVSGFKTRHNINCRVIKDRDNNKKFTIKLDR